LRYLRGTTNTCLSYSRPPTPSTTIKMEAYVDASYAGDVETRKSTTGYLIYIGGSPVIWSSKLQSTVSLSSTESETIAASSLAQEVCWASNFLKELGLKNDEPVVVWTDSQSMMAIATNPVHHSRVKHLEVKYFFIRQCVQAKTISLKYLPTTDMTADALTKPLQRVLFKRHAQHLIHDQSLSR
jgi:hypothetical protein